MTGETEDRIRLDEVFSGPGAKRVGLPLRGEITGKLEELFDRLVDAAQPSKVVEVGAFEADFSQRAHSRFPEADVFAFEANPRVAAQFADAVNATGVVYRHLAIGAEAGTATINVPEVIADNDMPFVNRMGSLHGLAVPDSRTIPIEVPMDTLDAAISVAPRDRIALWVDVEGAVDQVLAGAQGTIAATEVLVCELETSALWEGQALADDIRKLMAASGLQLVARDCQKPFQYNAVFVRPSLLEAPGVAAMIDEYADTAVELWNRVALRPAREQAPPVQEAPAPARRRRFWGRRKG